MVQLAMHQGHTLGRDHPYISSPQHMILVGFPSDLPHDPGSESVTLL